MTEGSRPGRIGQNGAVRILLVEDDARMRALVRRGLTEHGHAVEVAATGPDALTLARSGEFDVLVLDVMLPGCSGVDVIRRLRADAVPTPALMLTARDAAADVVSSLDAGADDYLTKPFSFAVLLARIRALGRRGPAVQEVRLQVADLVLDSGVHAVTRAGAAVPLTRTEFSLLECLMRHAGRVVTRQVLVDRVWSGGREVESNTLDAFVKSLRQKLDQGGRPRLIQTVRGVGYSIRAEPEP
jgi:DNA-binding response OmpR family regulator